MKWDVIGIQKGIRKGDVNRIEFSHLKSIMIGITKGIMKGTWKCVDMRITGRETVLGIESGCVRKGIVSNSLIQLSIHFLIHFLIQSP